MAFQPDRNRSNSNQHLPYYPPHSQTASSFPFPQPYPYPSQNPGPVAVGGFIPANPYPYPYPPPPPPQQYGYGQPPQDQSQTAQTSNPQASVNASSRMHRRDSQSSAYPGVNQTVPTHPMAYPPFQGFFPAPAHPPYTAHDSNSYPYPLYPNGAFNHSGLPPPDIDPVFFPPPTIDPVFMPQQNRVSTPAAPRSTNPVFAGYPPPNVDPAFLPRENHVPAPAPRRHNQLSRGYVPPDVDPIFYPQQSRGPTPAPRNSTPHNRPWSQPRSTASTPYDHPQILPFDTDPTQIFRRPSSDAQGPFNPFSRQPPVIPAATHRSAQSGTSGIYRHLGCNLDHYPYIDWIIFRHPDDARKYVDVDTTAPIRFTKLAVVPPVHRLRIGTRDSQNTPLGEAISRWGLIEVVKSNHITVWDVLWDIWAYFHLPLTESEKWSMAAYGDFEARVARHCVLRCDEEKIMPINRVKRRCDTLLGCLRYANLEIDYDFARTRMLYLSLEDADRRGA